MFSIRSVNLKCLCLAAAVAVVDGSVIAGHPQKGNGPQGNNAFKPQGGSAGSIVKNTGSPGNVLSNASKGNGGVVANGGIKVDPGKGNGIPGGMGQVNKGQ